MKSCPDDDQIAATMEKVRYSFQAGNLAAAKDGCLFILDTLPTTAEAWYYLGLIAHQQRHNEDALNFLRNATEHDPAWAEARNHYGNALRQHGRFEEALQQYQQARRLKSNYVSPDYNIGLVLISQGKPAEAELSFRSALAIKPDFVPALNSLNQLLKKQRRPGDIIKFFRSALTYNPDSFEILNNMAIALIDQKKSNEAVELCRRAVVIAPECAEVHNTLGLALMDSGARSEAAASFRRASAIRPDLPDPLNNLGNLLREDGQLAATFDCLQQALSLAPEFSPGWHGLGLYHKELGEIEEQIACFHKARLFDPCYIKAMVAEAGSYLDLGRVAEAIDIYRLLLTIDPDLPIARSNLLLTMHYPANYSAAEIFDESRRWDNLHGVVAKTDHGNNPDPSRKLRIGYVSADFRSHSVSYFLQTLFKNHNRSEIAITCYADQDEKDADKYTEFYKAHADCWRTIFDVEDAAVVQLVIDDAIDILVDLAGHTGKRLTVFTHKPAPIQVTWLGYPDTTGLTAMDYRFSDEIADPPGVADIVHSEKIVRLPGGFLCYTPPANAPEIRPSPLERNGCITFGCFNSLAKITPEIVTLWSNLLERIPGSRLLLKNRSFHYPVARSRYAEFFAENGIPAERIDLRTWELSTESHLAVYNEIDIALDCFPYNGTTTTCEALWMGVPVVTLTGERHAARVGASILSRVGLADLVAASSAEYVQIAETLAKDKARLFQIRCNLRNEMRISSLCDGKFFTGTIEMSFRRMWHDWCSYSSQP